VIPPARRFSLAALALFAIAAVPIWLHRVTGTTFDPCASPDRLRHLDAFGQSHSVREIGEQEALGHTLWVEGRLPDFAPRRALRFRVVRGVEPSAFYGDLRTYFYGPPPPEIHREAHALRVGSDVLPVHRQSEPSDRVLRLTHYFLVLGDQPVVHPLPSGLSLAVDQLVRGTQPVTLFLIAGLADAATRADFEKRADAWLTTAWLEYRSVCRS
jgi:hypothetical protein